MIKYIKVICLLIIAFCCFVGVISFFIYKREVINQNNRVLVCENRYNEYGQPFGQICKWVDKNNVPKN